MEKINYKYNWCDFFTPCPYRENINVGSYDCSICKCNNGIEQEKLDIDNLKYANLPPHIRRCLVNGNGVVKCNFLKNE